MVFNMESTNDNKESLNDFDKITVEYRGKTYTFKQAIQSGIITHRAEERELITSGDAEGDYEITPEHYRVNCNDITIVNGGLKFVLKAQDKVVFDSKNNLKEILIDYIKGQQAIVDGKPINIWCSTIYCQDNHDTLGENKCISFYTYDIVETKINGEDMFLTNNISVDSSTGHIIGGSLCTENDNKKCPDFSCYINNNKLDIEKCSRCDVLMKNGEIISLDVNSCKNDKLNTQIKYNGQKVFLPKGRSEIEITKLDNLIDFRNKKKISGINFNISTRNKKLSETDIGNDYVNANVLNYQFEKGKMREEDECDYILCDNGYTMAKYLEDNNIYILNNRGQCVLRYELPVNFRYVYRLKSKNIQKCFSTTQSCSMKNTSVNQNDLSKNSQKSDEKDIGKK